MFFSFIFHKNFLEHTPTQLCQLRDASMTPPWSARGLHGAAARDLTRSRNWKFSLNIQDKNKIKSSKALSVHTDER